MNEIKELYLKAVRNVPILKYSWILIATICLLTLTAYFKLKNSDVFFYAFGVLVISLIGFVLSYLTKSKDPTIKIAIYILIFSIVSTVAISILGFASFIFFGKPEFYQIWFPQKTNIQPTNENFEVIPNATIDNDSIVSNFIENKEDFVSEMPKTTSSKISVSCAPFYYLNYSRENGAIPETENKSSILVDAKDCSEINNHKKNVWFTSNAELLTRINVTYDKGIANSQIIINDIGIEVYTISKFPIQGFLNEYMTSTGATFEAASIRGIISNNNGLYSFFRESNKDNSENTVEVLKLGDITAYIARVDARRTTKNKAVMLRPYVEYSYQGRREISKSKNVIQYLFLNKKKSPFKVCEEGDGSDMEQYRDSVTGEITQQGLDVINYEERIKQNAYISLEKL